MTGKEALESLKETLNNVDNITFYQEEINAIEKELKALEIIKKYAKNDGWSNGWVIMFWNMKEKELKIVEEVLGNDTRRKR